MVWEAKGEVGMELGGAELEELAWEESGWSWAGLGMLSRSVWRRETLCVGTGTGGRTLPDTWAGMRGGTGRKLESNRYRCSSSRGAGGKPEGRLMDGLPLPCLFLFS